MIKFTKMQGIGNDYVYIDAINQKIKNEADLSKKISNRHFGVGSDGIILVYKSNIADFKMRIFNPDGSEAEMCGNGIRCFGKFIYDKKLTRKTKINIETLAGIKTLTLNIEEENVKTIKVDMGEPILEAEKIPVKIDEKSAQDFNLYIEKEIFNCTCISMGNPHTVIVIDDVNNFDVKKYGKQIEIDNKFPNKTNVEFVQIIDRKNIKMRVWERGTGETLACGTGACASVVACNLKKLVERKVDVELLGGKLHIECNEKDNHIYMTGPAVTVFEGKIDS